MTCNKCGTVCEADAKFCEVCGAALEAPAADNQNEDTKQNEQAQPNTGFTPAPEYANAAPTTPAVEEDPGKNMAMASLVCGIISIVCNCCGIPNILAIVFGIVAKSKGSKDSKATIGIILGVAAIALGIISAILSFATGIFSSIMEANYHY